MAQAKQQHRRFGNVRALPSGRFQARWQGPDGHFHTAPETFANREAAGLWLATQTVARADGNWVDRRVSGQPFGPVAATWVERRKKSGYRVSTLDRDLGHVDRYIAPRWDTTALDAITGDAIADWYLELGETLAPATVEKTGQLFRQILATAVRSNMLAANPTDGVALPRDPDPDEMMIATPAQIDALAEAITAHRAVRGPKDRRQPADRELWRAFVLTGAHCALRAGELLALRACDVDTERRRIHITRIVTEVAGKNHVGPPKTKAGRRIVPYPRALRGPLNDRLGAAEHPEDLLWPNSRGDYVGLSSFRSRIWKPATEAVDLEGFRIHDLRHTAITNWLAAGIDPKTIARWAGHRSVVTVLDRYAHPDDGDDPMGGLDDLLSRHRRPSGTITPIR